MSRPRPIDVAAREVREQLELAAMSGDADLALAAARRFAAEGLVLSVLPADFAAPRRQKSAPPAATFSWPFEARYAASCARCGGPIARGEQAVIRSQDRALLHPSCAQGER